MAAKPCAVLGGFKMRANHWVDPVYPETTLSNSSANVYDFGARQTESNRLRQIEVLEHENALLRRKVSEVRIEIMRLRKALATT